VKLRILGCGTSTGVPRVDTGWGACDPEEPRNHRLRSSLLIESADERLLVDCGPDLRQQLLAADCRRLDAVLITHDHADHCHGIDDLRPLVQSRGEPMPLIGRTDTLERLRHRFAYAFQSSRLYPAVAEPIVVGVQHRLGAAQLRFVDQPHGRINSVGIRIDEGGRSAGYAIDYHELTAEMAALYEGVEVWISDCLRRKPHPTHAHLDAVLGWARELKVGQLYLTHLDNSMDYRTLISELPDWAAPAHDGLEIAL
jgi:phosphoribosyl 1,2-cyclic phosphate phosphodiesterase